MYVSYNYSDLKIREKRIYSISGTKISSNGITISFIKVAAICLAIFNFIGIMICLIFGQFFYFPFDIYFNFNPTFLFLFIGIPMGLACALQYIRIQSYRLVEYLIAYFKPKTVINQQGIKIKLIKYKQKGFVENII